MADWPPLHTAVWLILSHLLSGVLNIHFFLFVYENKNNEVKGKSIPNIFLKMFKQALDE